MEENGGGDGYTGVSWVLLKTKIYVQEFLFFDCTGKYQILLIKHAVSVSKIKLFAIIYRTVSCRFLFTHQNKLRLFTNYSYQSIMRMLPPG